MCSDVEMVRQCDAVPRRDGQNFVFAIAVERNPSDSIHVQEIRLFEINLLLASVDNFQLTP